MRIMLVVSLIVILITVPVCASVSVSPVIVDSDNVKKGDLFRILCEQKAEDSLEIQLSLALFDQDPLGNVYFLEDPDSVLEVRRILQLKQEKITLDPQGKAVVELELLDDNFTNLYAVLFVKPLQSTISTRFAVLLLLSSQDVKERVQISTWEQKAESLELTVVNSGLRHGLWEGELLLYDQQGNLSEQRSIASGLVLAGRSREWGIALPSWVNHVELKGARRELDR